MDAKIVGEEGQQLAAFLAAGLPLLPTLIDRVLLLDS